MRWSMALHAPTMCKCSQLLFSYQLQKDKCLCSHFQCVMEKNAWNEIQTAAFPVTRSTLVSKRADGSNDAEYKSTRGKGQSSIFSASASQLIVISDVSREQKKPMRKRMRRRKIYAELFRLTNRFCLLRNTFSLVYRCFPVLNDNRKNDEQKEERTTSQ